MDDTADIPYAAKEIYRGASFDNNLLCLAEKEVFVMGSVADRLLEGYGNDNPGAKSQGMKQLMAGGGVALIDITLVPLLSGLFTA